MKIRVLLFLGFTLSMAINSSAQLDTKHWIPPFFAKVEDQSGTSNIRDHFVSLSTPAEDTIPVTIRDGYGNLIDIVEISRNMPVEYTFGPQGNATGNPATSVYPLNVIPRDSLNMPIRSQGLYFESFQPFFVNMRHKSGSQGTSLTSKGQVGLGERFYSGHLYTIYNTDETWNNFRRSHFISVMATEDNTTITFDMIKDPIYYIGQTPGEPITVTLDEFESYVIGVDHADFDNATINNANGTRITSDKPIVCNTGSWLSGNQSGQCIGSDQLVPAEVTGQEYILVRGLGDETTERPMAVATEDNTQIFVNDNPVPVAELDEGETYFFPTSDFSANDNMYVLASEKIYMFQTLSGSSTQIGPTVGLNFIPPLNCIGAKEVNLPFVNSLAGGNGQGRINIVTKAGTTIFVNESNTPLTGAQPVPGITDWVTYAFDPPTDNVIIESDSVMNVALLTRDNVVGTAGYFSGFTLEPVVGLSAGIQGSLPCIPGNASLQVFGFDTYQWYFNGEEIPGATDNTLFPEFSGSYIVEGIDLACGFRFPSNSFNIPFCPSTLGAAKNVQLVQETAPGSRIFDVTYRINIENLALSPSQNIQVLENINGGLPVGATAELIGEPALIFGLLSGGLNPDFDGVTDRRLLPGTGALPGSAGDAIELTIRVDMNDAIQDGYFNQVTVTSKNEGVNDGINGPFNGQDFSDAGTDPDPDEDGEPNEEGENDPTLTCFFTNEIQYDSELLCVTTDSIPVEQDGVSSGFFESDIEGLSINSETGTLFPEQSTPGTYVVTFTVEGRCPTVTTTEITIVEPGTSGSAVEDLQFCEGSEVIELTSLLEGEDDGGVFSDADGNEVGASFDPFIEGNFTFTYTIENSPCAAVETSFTIEVIEEPTPGTPADQLNFCEAETEIVLSSLLENEDEGGVWTDQDGNELGDTYSLSESGIFDLTYTVSNPVCGERSTTVEIDITPLPNPGVPFGEEVFCAGEEVDLNTLLTGQDLDGFWIDGEGQDVNDVITVSDPGTYIYTYVIDRDPCESDSAEVNITSVAGPSSGLADPVTFVCLNDPVINLFALLEGETNDGEFTDGDGNVISSDFFPTELGTYEFTYTVTSEECGFISTEFQITVTEDNCLDQPVIIPEGFSPNGDGIADQWIIEGLFQFPDNSLQIFNRWGNEILNARPYNNNWNGKATNGLNTSEDLPVGTYWYILDLGDGSEIRKGFVYLNR